MLESSPLYLGIALCRIHRTAQTMLPSKTLHLSIAFTVVAMVSCCPNMALATAEEVRSIDRGYQFLIGLMDPDLDLLPEFPGASVFWLYHDNYLAAKVLAESHPQFSKRIKTAIRQRGANQSGKIEILFDEATEPLPLRQYQLVNLKKVGDKTIRTERVTDQLMMGWEAYADLRFFAAIALAESKPQAAQQQLAAGLKMWDGHGFNDPATKHLGIYATYKLALAAIAASKLKQLDDLPPTLVPKLRKMQAKSGGWITDYRSDGTPIGKANVETTSLAILALESIAGDR